MACGKREAVTLGMPLFMLLLSSIVFSANGGPYDALTMEENAKAISSYQAMLKDNCSEKHFESLTPGDLSGAVEDFSNQLSSDQIAQVAQVAKIDTVCADVTMGAACGNQADIRAFWKLGLLSNFAKAICKMPISCRATPSPNGDYYSCE